LELLALKLDCSLTYLINGVTAEQMEELELGLRFARLALENGEVAEARRRYAELLQDNSLAGLASLRQDAHYGFALATEACGDLSGAIAVLKTLHETDREGQSDTRRIEIGIALCRCYRERGDLRTAARVGEQMVGHMTGAASGGTWSDDLLELGSTLLSVYIERGDLLRARQFAGELLSAAEALGTPRAIVAACWNAAMAAERVGAGEEAMALIERALAVHSENGEPRNLARLRSAYAKLLLRIRPSEAEAARDLSLRALRELKESSAGAAAIARCELNIARAEMALDAPEKALEHAQMAQEIADETNGAVLADVHLVLGQAYFLLRRDEESAAELATAGECLARIPATRQTAESWQAAAETLGRLGDHGASATAYERALACAGL
jgi:tetratricopeptide (TPR) repeat protein